MKPQRILCPIDFSHTAREAFRYAIDLARQYESTLYLLHVGDPPVLVLPDGGTVLPGPEKLAGWLEQIEVALGDYRRQALEFGVRSVETSTSQGDPWREIVSFATNRDCDLIVIGTHGRTGLRHVLVGSVAERVVRHANCPVLTVRPTGQTFTTNPPL